MSKRDKIAEINEDFKLLSSDFNDAILGYIESSDKYSAVYDKDKCIKILENRGMSTEEALEYFEHNILNGYLGEYTPVFLTYI